MRPPLPLKGVFPLPCVPFKTEGEKLSYHLFVLSPFKNLSGKEKDNGHGNHVAYHYQYISEDDIKLLRICGIVTLRKGYGSAKFYERDHGDKENDEVFKSQFEPAFPITFLHPVKAKFPFKFLRECFSLILKLLLDI